MSKARLVWVSLVLSCAVLAVALLVLSRKTARLEEQTSESLRLREQNGKLQAEAEQLRRELGALLGRPSAGIVEPRTPSPRVRRPELPSSTLEALRSLGQLREELAAARSSSQKLQDRVSQLEAELEKAHRENSALNARQAELHEQLLGATRLVEAMQEELKGKNERLEPLQAANRSLREENRQAREKLRRVTELSAQLEDLNRRREAYLTGIIRRYRELADQYKALSGRPVDRVETPPPTDVSRIENTIALAEEDLRQLRNLNAQAERIQRQIAKN